MSKRDNVVFVSVYVLIVCLLIAAHRSLKGYDDQGWSALIDWMLVAFSAMIMFTFLERSFWSAVVGLIVGGVSVLICISLVYPLTDGMITSKFSQGLLFAGGSYSLIYIVALLVINNSDKQSS